MPCSVLYSPYLSARLPTVLTSDIIMWQVHIYQTIRCRR